MTPEEKLLAINDLIWEQGMGLTNDVEHIIHSHAESLPDYYRKLADLIQQIEKLSNSNPDIG